MTEVNQPVPIHDIPLAEMIRTLRDELQISMKTSQKEPLRFRIQNIELELKVAVSREGGGSAGVKFWVVTAEGKGSFKHEDTHTFKLTLQPVTSAGDQALVAGAEGQKPE